MKKYILGTLFTLCLLLSPVFTPPAEAASLTPVQISAIISLLQVLGVDQSVIDSIQTSLGGTTIVTPPAVITPTHKLPPTGITFYSDATTNTANASIAADTGAFPRQDARYARPFDYTKIANDGSTLPATATLGTGAKDWACTKDNITGLIWEVKTTSGLRSKDNTYTWYKNGVGIESKGTCQTSGHCDTEKYVEDVKATSLCGFTDWRMPEVIELQGIVDFGRFNPAIDHDYFPNTLTEHNYWTSILGGENPTLSAWYVSFGSGIPAYDMDKVGNSVRLVRSDTPASEVPHTARCFDNLSPSNPDTVYATPESNDGTIIDNRTSLMWKRCSEGQTWDKTTHSCTGLASNISWADALKLSSNSTFEGNTDWRLPNVKELRSLTEECRSIPAVNETAFPNVPFSTYWWSNSPALDYYQNQNLSWVVSAGTGLVASYTRDYNWNARLVRDVTTASVSNTSPTASLTINGQTQVNNADPLVSRTWAWSGTSGATYTASGNITGCDTASQNGPQSNWKPWTDTKATGNATNGSSSIIPGAVKYGCVITGTYNVTKDGQTTTATATITYKHADGSANTTVIDTGSDNSTNSYSYPSPCPTSCGASQLTQTQTCPSGTCSGSPASRTCNATAACYVAVNPHANDICSDGHSVAWYSQTVHVVVSPFPANPTCDDYGVGFPAVFLSSLSPSSGTVGTTVTITASGLLGTNSIYLNGSPVDTLNSSGGSTPTWISFVIPSNLPSCPAWDRFCTSGPVLTPGTYTVSVQNTNGTSNTLSLVVN